MPDLTDPGEALTADTDPVRGRSVGTEPLEQTFTVASDLGYPWLPVAYPPQQIDVPDTTVRYNGSTGTATLDDVLDAGDSYHGHVGPRAAHARAAGERSRSRRRRRPTAHVARRTSPPTWPPGSARSPSSGREGAANDYERVLAIQDHLNDDAEFTYDETVPARDDSFTLLEFLTKTKRGLLPAVRERHGRDAPHAGIPSRVAVGFTPGERTPTPTALPRHHERAPRLGRGAVPDVRLAGVRADARPRRTPSRTRIRTRSSACPPGTPGCPDARGRRRGRGTRRDRERRAAFPRSCRTWPAASSQVGAALHRSPPIEAADGQHAPRRRARRSCRCSASALVVALAIPPLRALRRRRRLRRAGRRAAGADPRDVRRVHRAGGRPGSSAGAGRDAPGVPAPPRAPAG